MIVLIVSFIIMFVYYHIYRAQLLPRSFEAIETRVRAILVLASWLPDSSWQIAGKIVSQCDGQRQTD